MTQFFDYMIRVLSFGMIENWTELETLATSTFLAIVIVSFLVWFLIIFAAKVVFDNVNIRTHL